jgi:hypothetical protein
MKRKFNNHALQASTTTPTIQMQARIHQLKLGVDWHIDHFRMAPALLGGIVIKLTRLCRLLWAEC